MTQVNSQPSSDNSEFTVRQGEQTQQVTGRANAVEMAKELSQAERRTVEVRREDGLVVMRFRAGELESLTYHTGDRRRPG